ncbi:MAG TPA: ATPase, T2SS/T4P/T4SS family [Coriobacteriia bacterium]|jgi:type IV pilus assembly protein PilB
MEYRHERLGELLIRGGLITDEQLEEALEVQRRVGGKLGEVLVTQLLASEEQIAQTLADQKGFEFVNLASVGIDRTATTRIPERVARMRRIIPIAYDDGAIVLAMADPLDIEAIDDVRVRAGLPVKPVVATNSQIAHAIEKFIASADAFADVVDEAAEREDAATEAQAAGTEDVPVVRLVNQLIREAVADRASDIHLEPGETKMRVRYRVDGVLFDVMEIPRNARAGITSRIKIMADMDISERRLPQDGRIQVQVEGKTVDMRVATLPTPSGEEITIRLLNQGLTFHSLGDLGMTPEQLAQMEDFLSKPYGALLLAGPTGSGKSTTLYASLKRLNCPERKIITVEDPIEYRMDGLTQIPVNGKIGLTFARALRSILRSDPDVVMIGEMRDPETAEIGVRAALTGHLVLSSIHTNDAPAALTRLVDMDVAPYVTSSALIGVVAQRLARRLCPKCKKVADIPPDALVQAGFSVEEAAKVKTYRAVGCTDCLDTGYRGRIGLFEMMPVDDDIRRLFLHEAPLDQLRAAAVEHGMKPLMRDALDKVASGETSLEEIARVVV